MAFEWQNFTRDKQHINLSECAIGIMESDMNSFNETKVSAFLNRIFENYYETADASISIRLEDEKEKLHSLLDNSFDKPTVQKVISLLTENKKDELLTTTSTYKKGVGFKFRIRNDNFDYLEGPDCKENNYYPRLGEYYKAVIEEYSLKPYFERERIYYKSYSDIIEAAIKYGYQLKITLRTKNAFMISPYALMTDSSKNYNYLVGYGKCISGENIEDKKPFSFRLTNITSIKTYKTLNSCFRKEDKINLSKKKEIEAILSQRGVQFVFSDTSDIKIKLTPTGKKMYHSQKHLRPDFTRIIDDDIYVFNCTANQIEFYFFKFGKNAKIIEPAELSQKFEQMYKDAAETYLKN